MYMYNINLTYVPVKLYTHARGGRTMAETLGGRIRKARERYGMSQAELARRIGISKNSMNLIEASKTPDPSVLKVRAIATTLNVSADYLLGFSDDPTPAKRPRPRKTAPVG